MAAQSVLHNAQARVGAQRQSALADARSGQTLQRPVPCCSKAARHGAGRSAAGGARARAHVGERAPQVAAARGAVVQAVRALPQLVARLLGAARRARAAPPGLARAARARLRGRHVGREGRVAAVVHAPPGLARARLRRRQIGREGRVPAVIQVPAVLRAAAAARARGRRAAGAPAPARGRAALAVEHAQARAHRLCAAQAAQRPEQGGPARRAAWEASWCMQAKWRTDGALLLAARQRDQAARPKGQRELCSAQPCPHTGALGSGCAHLPCRVGCVRLAGRLAPRAAGRGAAAADIAARTRDLARPRACGAERTGLSRHALARTGSGPAPSADDRPGPLTSARCLQRGAPDQAAPTGAPGPQLGVLHPNFTGASAAQPGAPAAAGRAVRPQSRATRSTGPKLGRPKRPCAQQWAHPSARSGHPRAFCPVCVHSSPGTPAHRQHHPRRQSRRERPQHAWTTASRASIRRPPLPRSSRTAASDPAGPQMQLPPRRLTPRRKPWPRTCCSPGPERPAGRCSKHLHT